MNTTDRDGLLFQMSEDIGHIKGVMEKLHTPQDCPNMQAMLVMKPQVDDLRQQHNRMKGGVTLAIILIGIVLPIVLHFIK